MDAARSKRRSSKRELDAVVRELAVAVARVESVLLAAVREGNAGSRFGELVRGCSAAWPVEGGNHDEVVKSVAMLLVLRRVVIRVMGEDHGCWEVVGTGETADERLAHACEAAERIPQVDECLAELNRRLPAELQAIVWAQAEQAKAVMPLSIVYEPLLARIDRAQRSRRGVFHTPRAIVRWMVEAVQWMVQQNASALDRLRFVDMGCGCGSFLSEARRRFGGQYARENRECSYLGYEVLPTSRAMARWSLRGGESVGRQEEGLNLELRWANPLLRGEAERERILRDGEMPVFLGNPPYASFGRGNRSPWIDGLMQDYRRGLAERKANLDDDFIKFIRWGQHWIDAAGRGILAVVTSSTYLRGMTHRRMRQSLLESFDRILVLDLHGDPYRSAGDEADENVFDVRSGIAIGLFVKAGNPGATKETLFAEKRGTREQKFAWLDETPASEIDWKAIDPGEPDFSFEIRKYARTHDREYESYWPLTRIFREWVSGVQSKNDALFVDVDREALAERMRSYLDQTGTGDPSRELPAFDESHLRPYLLAPFDRRWIYYDPRLLGRARHAVMRHMLQPNIGLVFMRQSTNSGEYDHFLAVDCLVSDRVFFSRHGAPYLAPLWLYPDDSTVDESRQANFTEEWFAEVARRISDKPDAWQVFDFIYGIVHGRSYRERFADALRVDFPRIPLPASQSHFATIAAIGQQLRRLHVEMEVVSDAEPSQEHAPVTIGGYDVLKRWRKALQAKTQSPAATVSESRLRRVLAETCRLREELDALESTTFEINSPQSSASCVPDT